VRWFAPRCGHGWWLTRWWRFVLASPTAKSAGELALARDLIAGPDDADALAYKLVLAAPRHTDLKDFRCRSPLVPTAGTVCSALAKIADRLAKRGVKVVSRSPVLVDLALVGRVFTQLLMAFFGADMPEDVYALLQSAAATLPPDDVGLIAMGLRGSVLESSRIDQDPKRHCRSVASALLRMGHAGVPGRADAHGRFRRTQNGREFEYSPAEVGVKAACDRIGC
jgi:hypothetical protein